MSNFISSQLQLANKFSSIYTSDNNSKLLEISKVQNALQQIYSYEESADFTNNIFLSEKLGRKYKCCMSRMLPVVYKLYNQYSKYTPLQLSISSNNLLDIYINKSIIISNNNYLFTLGNTFENTEEYLHFKYCKMDISRVFDDLQALGAMICVDDFYTYNHNCNDVSKTYILSSKLLKSILSLSNIDINNITSNNITYTDNDIYNYTLGNTFDSWSQKDVNVYNKCKNIIEKCLTKQSMLPVDCRYYISKERSLRPYAKFCSQWKSMEKALTKYNSTTDKVISAEQFKQLPENIGTEWREDYLDKYFGKDNWIEFDRNASIYNVTLLYNRGIYRPNNAKDMYEEFNGKPFSSKQERLDFKLCNMSLYFGDVRKLKSFYDHMSSTAKLWTAYSNGEKLSNKDKKTICHFLNNKDRFAAMLKFSNCYEKASSWEEGWILVKEWYVNTRKNMVSIIGKSHKKTVFMIESAVNLTVAERIRKAGYKVLEVYDGFYTNCKDTNLLENIYKDTAIEIINKIK